ncbi:DUF3393 domain-containing protein [Aliidiomarina halalkaliphila]|uniref:DUF3393 domain-containing protein n=1 Tax=Aliidiomarina halalkaliphila TaxID=2593535 RepID=A0A552X4E3_9GAMM|nr:murein transglycosylase domain-containing protein [Aliidiomarina halalkaliphila]TRW49890.1 DUF3393 domain-containing protein [Aliidiomarina halalkaliphila]
MLKVPSRVGMWLLAVALSVLLVSCSLSRDDLRTIAERTQAKEYARIILDEQLEPYGGTEAFKNIGTVREVLEILAIVIEDIWGKDEQEVPSEKRYVKYSNAYQARAIVDFERGYLQVETIAQDDPIELLREALVVALLTPRNLTLEDIFSDDDPVLGDEPFLYPQVLDQDNEAIRYEWRARRFADYLITHSLRSRNSDGRRIHFVRTDLVDNHLHLRQLQFSDSVLRYSREYNIAPSLVYAVIEIESAFNPYAVSHANALGLMQVVPATAGRDVFERVKGIDGEPTRQQLFVADFNVDIGTGYLYLLDQVYLNRIRNPQSRQWAKISAYNGGAGNVFRTFGSSSEQALNEINRLTSEQVYQRLVQQHPFAETRNYLQKVRGVLPKYSQ